MILENVLNVTELEVFQTIWNDTYEASIIFVTSEAIKDFLLKMKCSLILFESWVGNQKVFLSSNFELSMKPSINYETGENL